MVVCTACYSPLKFIIYPLVLCCVWLFGWLRHVMMCICMLTLSTCYDVYAHLVFHLSCYLWMVILNPLIIVIVKKLQTVVCLPTEHVWVHSLKHVRAFQIELEFGSASFQGEGITGVPGEKSVGGKERTKNKLNPHMASTPRFQPRPHWWGWVLSPLHNPCSLSILVSMYATLYFHLLWSICTVTQRVINFMHGFFQWLWMLPSIFFHQPWFLCFLLLTYGRSICNHSECYFVWSMETANK